MTLTDSITSRAAETTPNLESAPANPVLIEVTRGQRVESRHRGAIAVADASGRLLKSWGDIRRGVYPRSAVKPLQALALLQSGAADRFGLSEREIAAACGSHRGEPVHNTTIERWIARLGLSDRDLECGTHPPRDDTEAARLLRGEIAPTPIHNNCSGKHAGFLTTALQLGAPTAGYIAPDHPVQTLVRTILSEICDFPLSAEDAAIDGCGVPTYALPLAALATGLARLGSPPHLTGARRAAAERINRAIGANPVMVAGTGMLPTLVIAATDGRVLVKSGAEGVYVAWLPGRGEAAALKIDDGDRRGSTATLVNLLREIDWITAAEASRLQEFSLPRVVQNVAGAPIGLIRPSACWRDLGAPN